MRAINAQSVAIIGIGNPMRADDGVGSAAVACLEQMDLFDVTGGCVELLRLDGEPTRLIDAWRDRRRTIVIDAARSGAVAGSIHRVEVGLDPLPKWAAGRSSHSAGLAEAIDLGQTLDRLPETLVVLGMEVADLSLGEGLSDEVRDALPGLVRRAIAEAGL